MGNDNQGNQRHAPNSKLTAQSVAAAKVRIVEGESFTVLAHELGVCYQAVYNIATGKSWGEVPPCGNLVTRPRTTRALSPKRRDRLYLLKLRKGWSNAKLAQRAGVSEATIARAMRDARIVLAFRVQRLLLTSGSHQLAMERFQLDRNEAEQLSGVAASSRIPQHLAEELDT